MTPFHLQLIALVCTATAAVLAGIALMRRRRPNTTAASPGARGLRLLVSPLAERMLPTTQAELEVVVDALAAAGRREREAVLRFAEERVLAMIAGFGVAVFMMFVVGDLFGLLLGLCALLYGILGPPRRLRQVAEARQEKVRVALPGTVDLLTTCVDAGLSLQQALARVAREVGASHPVFAEELNVTAKEIDAGVPVADALRRLSRRVKVDEMSALCGVIAQAHGLGAPIGRTLHDYAESSRRQQMSLLEERTGKLAAQLVLPLALFLLPAALLTIIGPSVLQLMEAFK